MHCGAAVQRVRQCGSPALHGTGRQRYTPSVTNRIDITVTVTVKSKTPLVVPSAIRRRAGIRSGDKLEFKVSRGVITILPKPPADDESTPAQRRRIDRGIAKGLEEIGKGRAHGPFGTADEAIAHLKALARRRKTASRIAS